MRLQLLLTLLTLSLSIFLGNVFAATQPSIGLIISVQGQVVAINQANQERPLQRGAVIYLYDKIVTKQDSKAQLRLQDDSMIVIEPASEFYVSEFSFNKNNPHNNKYVGNIVKGMLVNISGEGDTKNYTLNSPLTTIAFRGTGLATKLVAKNDQLTNQEVYVFQGYVAVKNRCKNVIGPCEPDYINIGVGQRINSAIVNRTGKIKGFNGSGLLSRSNIELNSGKVVIKAPGYGGKVSIVCKSK